MLGIISREATMSTKFGEIRITGLAAEKTQQSHKAAGLRLMHLTLSLRPSAEWVECFNEARRFPRHGMWRHAWIEGADIVVECVPEEIEQYHLKDLKEDVVTANQKYLEWEARVEAQAARSRDEQEKERLRLEAVKSKLKFD
jgi:hypothetical protein